MPFMARKRTTTTKNGANGPDLFGNITSRRRRPLILPRLLAVEAESNFLKGPKQDKAYEILKKWADLEEKGHLHKKEKSLDANFLHEVFDAALGYATSTQSPDHWQLEREFSTPVGPVDGALGQFTPPAASEPTAVIELKDADKDLDRDKSQGRTPVQQCWDYLNALPNCTWCIVSNFVSIRLYHKGTGSQAYQEFRLQELRKIEVFRQFYCLFEYGGLLKSQANQQPRAVLLLEKSSERQRTVGSELYEHYNRNRYGLVEFLVRNRGKSLDKAIHIAQKLLDRVIFIAFCEDRGLIPEKSIDKAHSHLPAFSNVTNPRWQNFLYLFKGMDQGNVRDLHLEKGYNGGLFAEDPEVDNIHLLDDDPWTNFFNTIGGYDFRDEINVDVLGHLFERSVGDLQRLQSSGLAPVNSLLKKGNGAQPKMQKSPERKRSGIYYTPPEFTRFIVDHTIVELLDQRFAALRDRHKLKEDPERADKPSPTLAAYWNDCLETLKRFKVCDPACGSGAFLIQAYDALEAQYDLIADHLHLHDEKAADRLRDAIPDLILTHNLFGVDLSEQAVEITQLALWIRSARRDKTLADLSKNIVWGNSLVTDANVHPKALKWEEAFPAVFAKGEQSSPLSPTGGEGPGVRGAKRQGPECYQCWTVYQGWPMARTRTNKRQPNLRDLARDLRTRMTPAERILWKELRSRRFAGFKFRRQYTYGPYILDFFCTEVGVCVEPDGESHVGKETEGNQRQAWLESQGIKVIRVYNHDVYEDKDVVLEAIYRECVARQRGARPPHPQPLSPGGGEGSQTPADPHGPARREGTTMTKQARDRERA